MSDWSHSEKWAISISTSYGWVDVELVRRLPDRDWGVYLDAHAPSGVHLATRYRSVPPDADLRDVKALLPGLLEDIEKEASHKVGAGLAEVMP